MRTFLRTTTTTTSLFILLVLGSSLITGQGLRSSVERGPGEEEDGEDFENEELEHNNVGRMTTIASTEFVPLEVC